MRVVAVLSPLDTWSGSAWLAALARHAAAGGCETLLATTAQHADRTTAHREAPVVPDPAVPGPDVPTCDLADLVPNGDDIVFFAAATTHHLVLGHYGKLRPRFVQLVAEGRPLVTGPGAAYGYRLLAKPMRRVAPTEAVRDILAKRAEAPHALSLIRPAVDPARFTTPAPGERTAVAVALADGPVPQRVLEAAPMRALAPPVEVLQADDPVARRAAVLARARVFVAAPRPSEAFHTPSLEAALAGCTVLIAAGAAATALVADTARPIVMERAGIGEAAHRLAHMLQEKPARAVHAPAVPRGAALDVDGERRAVEALLRAVEAGVERSRDPRPVPSDAVGEEP